MISGYENVTRLVVAGIVLALPTGFVWNGDPIGAPTRKPNVVIILADQWNAQSLEYAGNADVKTPNLDRLA